MASNTPALALDGGTLHLQGRLDRATATALWPQLSALAGRVQAVDLAAVEQADSAGVALLAELAAQVRQQGRVLAMHGAPAGFDELRAAYRLDADLDFNATTATS